MLQMAGWLMGRSFIALPAGYSNRWASHWSWGKSNFPGSRRPVLRSRRAPPARIGPPIRSAQPGRHYHSTDHSTSPHFTSACCSFKYYNWVNQGGGCTPVTCLETSGRTSPDSKLSPLCGHGPNGAKKKVSWSPRLMDLVNLPGGQVTEDGEIEHFLEVGILFVRAAALNK